MNFGTPLEKSLSISHWRLNVCVVICTSRRNSFCRPAQFLRRSRRTNFFLHRRRAITMGQMDNVNPIGEHGLYLVLYVSNAGGV